MSKLIVEMEMPKDLAVIVTILPDGRIFKHLGYKDKKQIGKIIGELPDEHGDLIDRDSYLKLLESYMESQRGACENKEFIAALQTIIKQIKCVKAVIEAVIG